MKNPLTLVIMDGYGINADTYQNAVAAGTDRLARLFSGNPYTEISASGPDVGLPDGQMGNSEVGHTNIGAGRVVYQLIDKISNAIRDGGFFENPAITAAAAAARESGAALHLIGLVSDGGVHSHIEHLFALLELAKRQGLTRVYVHALLDGRDVSPTSGVDFLAELTAEMKRLGVGRIATVMGRYYAMDRDFAWDRVEKGYAAMVYGDGEKADNAEAAVRSSYAAGVTDEFILPTVIGGGACVEAGDSVVFFNFRPDRARQITRAFVDPDFDGFPRRKGFFPLRYVCMAPYDAVMPNVSVAFTPPDLSMTMGEYLCVKGLTQLRIAETQKYAHVTFFFNGGEERVFPGEDRVLIPSPKVATFDLMPEMSAYPVCEAVCERILSGAYDVIILNFANCDMVGHTGIYDAAVAAVRAVDECVARVVDTTLSAGGTAVITADHGNAEKMAEPDGAPFTAHTTNPVPFCIVGYPCPNGLARGGRLADIAPTMLHMMGLPQPPEMDGRSLIL